MTRELVRVLKELPESGAPLRATQSTLANVVATTVGAAHHPGTEALLARRSGGPAVQAPAHPGTHGLLDVATAVGFAAHLEDFDDTDLATVLHPGAPVLGACLPLSQVVGATGWQMLDAFAVGCEVEMRLARAISPSHYDLGWHITGTCGVIGAAVAASRLLRLGAQQTCHAIGLAAAQTLGHREAFGTMTKALHPGKAASNGVLAAWLARQGLRGPEEPLAGPGGFVETLSRTFDPEALTDRLGDEWVLEQNSFKPYPCGIVSHPAIDAGIALHDRVGDVGDVTSVSIRCHPLVVELTGNPDPRDALEAKFSTIHGCAAGLLCGVVGLRQYDDEFVTSSPLVRLRATAELVVDATMARDEAAVVVGGRGGETSSVHVDHARGSLARPLTDDELTAKMTALVEPVLPGRYRGIAAAIDSLPGASSVAELIASIGSPSTPTAAGGPDV